MRARAPDAPKRERAEEIHAWKIDRGSEVARAFARHEPDLLLAIRRGERGEARKLLNALLLHLYNLARGDFVTIRSLITDLLGQMRHAVLSCGVDV